MTENTPVVAKPNNKRRLVDVLEDEYDMYNEDIQKHLDEVEFAMKKKRGKLPLNAEPVNDENLDGTYDDLTLPELEKEKEDWEVEKSKQEVVARMINSRVYEVVELLECYSEYFDSELVRMLELKLKVNKSNFLDWDCIDSTGRLVPE
jgi:hypothetical protein